MKEKMNRAMIAIDAFIRGYKTGTISSKIVLIVFQQIFGDSIVIQNSLFEYTKIFPKSEGYEIHFLVRPNVLQFMQSTLPLPEDIIFESLDFKRFLEDYSYYRKVVKKYRGIAGTLIIPGTSFSAEVFAVTSDAKKKIGLVRSIDVTKPWIMSYFYRRAYTDRVRPEKKDMMLLRHRKLIDFLSQGKNIDYKAKLPELLPQKRVVEGHYAVMCPGSSKTEKCWPITRFAKVADYIIEKYGLDIHLCGGKEEEPFTEGLLSHVKHKSNIISHIGNTSFSNWSAIIQHADIVLGNDSATLHIAAAARVPSVCIAGVYDKFQFFPYQVDIEEDKLPVTLYKDMDCAWCRTIGYNAGFGNEECKKRIQMGQCSICVNLITVEEVKMAIDGLMKEVVL